ncbi:MAG: tyrosine--tRNA ligase [Candidatus Magasanikbacteria bacterium RIFCSPHIGHO2_02_FULL_51_14]|uniref:Tyrosine--tRNA ligase n=1 Tax=Candidatus Magasanikbacteria bacterium RIFCSPHIGHO2_02_FULL_51_14 TaxID=1798683 RepID=A0A1F6MPZ9_9BACT|nr:MAG: tyrosine--tRNA ligase [Candidatus Magasanikbacteria bacterium RIFCSPHIGHO2_02_FULL_51_14]
MVTTDIKQINELLIRGVENVYPTREFLEERLKSGERLTVYTGYDPTAPTLHIGHGITMLKLRQFQELGHNVIFLIGDFTGMIGDPTDKTAARKKLTRKDVLFNCKLYQQQASAILDFGGENPVEIRYNSEWLGKMTYANVLELSSLVTVPRLMERDMFQERLKENKTIYLHELQYPLMQGYDSVAMDVDGEVGGNDQTFNMLVGRDLMKELKHKEKFVIAMKLLVDPSGKKMGKTTGNMVALSDAGEDMFGKVMSWGDDMILLGFELCTRVPMKEIEKMEKKMKAGENPRDFKLALAREITGLFLGEDAAKRGEEFFGRVIQRSEIPKTMPELRPSAYDIVTVLVKAGLAGSKSEARRLIDENGVRVNDRIVETYDVVTKMGDVVQKGKRYFVRIL